MTEEDVKDIEEEYVRLKKLREGFNSYFDQIKEDHVKDEDADMSGWLEDWEKNMKDFKADEMLSFELAARCKIISPSYIYNTNYFSFLLAFEVFFENINKPGLVRGAYFLNFDSKDGLDLKIVDPKNNEVHKTVGKRQGIFSFEATEIGTYSFYF